MFVMAQGDIKLLKTTRACSFGKQSTKLQVPWHSRIPALERTRVASAPPSQPSLTSHPSRAAPPLVIGHSLYFPVSVTLGSLSLGGAEDASLTQQLPHKASPMSLPQTGKNVCYSVWFQTWSQSPSLVLGTQRRNHHAPRPRVHNAASEQPYHLANDRCHRDPDRAAGPQGLEQRPEHDLVGAVHDEEVTLAEGVTFGYHCRVPALPRVPFHLILTKTLQQTHLRHDHPSSSLLSGLPLLPVVSIFLPRSRQRKLLKMQSACSST